MRKYRLFALLASVTLSIMAASVFAGPPPGGGTIGGGPMPPGGPGGPGGGPQCQCPQGWSLNAGHCQFDHFTQINNSSILSVECTMSCNGQPGCILLPLGSLGPVSPFCPGDPGFQDAYDHFCLGIPYPPGPPGCSQVCGQFDQFGHCMWWMANGFDPHCAPAQATNTTDDPCWFDHNTDLWGANFPFCGCPEDSVTHEHITGERCRQIIESEEGPNPMCPPPNAPCWNTTNGPSYIAACCG